MASMENYFRVVWMAIFENQRKLVKLCENLSRDFVARVKTNINRDWSEFW